MKIFKSFSLILAIFVIAGVSSVSSWGLESGLLVKDTQMIEGDEGTSMMEFTVIISATPAVPVEFTYKTSDGTAKAGKDYKQTAGVGTIAAGQQTTTILIPIINDKKLTKNTKIFNVTIASQKVAIFVAQATGTIIDNDIFVAESKAEPSSKSSKKGKK